MAVQDGSQHQGFVQQRRDPLLVGFDTDNTVLGEASSAISQQSDRLQQVLDQDGLEDVQFELTVRTSDGDSGVVTHNLSGDHGQGFTLGRVDLSGHDGRSRLVFGQREFSQTASGTGSEVSDVVGDLHEGDSDSVQCTRSFDDGVVGGQGLELANIPFSRFFEDVFFNGHLPCSERSQICSLRSRKWRRRP